MSRPSLSLKMSLYILFCHFNAPKLKFYSLRPTPICDN